MVRATHSKINIVYIAFIILYFIPIMDVYCAPTKDFSQADTTDLPQGDADLQRNTSIALNDAANYDSDVTIEMWDSNHAELLRNNTFREETITQLTNKRGAGSPDYKRRALNILQYLVRTIRVTRMPLLRNRSGRASLISGHRSASLSKRNIKKIESKLYEISDSGGKLLPLQDALAKEHGLERTVSITTGIQVPENPENGLERTVSMTSNSRNRSYSRLRSGIKVPENPENGIERTVSMTKT